MGRYDIKNPDTLVGEGGFISPRGMEGHELDVRVSPRELSNPGASRMWHVPYKETGKGKTTKLAAFGLNQAIIDNGSPRYKACLKQANQYRKQRIKELHQLHGWVSSGAGALLASASLALAASRFLFERFAEPESSGLQGAGELECLKMASTLADKARSSELAAWEMSAREGILRRRAESANSDVPWLETPQSRKPGRKTNAERQAIDMDVPGRMVDESNGLPEE